MRGIRSNNLREKLLKTKNLDLSDYIQICRAEGEPAKVIFKMVKTQQFDKMVKATDVLSIKKANEIRNNQLVPKSEG